ncbi:MAG: glutamate racemase, partial [bacterium]
MSKSIGFFDSGFGGLNILKEVVKELPEYNFIYLGDTARVPYGTRSKNLIYQFTEQAVDFLFNKNCQLIILACNTASCDALRKIQQEYLPKKHSDRRVLGVLIPAAEEAESKTKNNRIGIMATEGSVSSGAFEREIRKLNLKVKVIQQSCPLLVPLIESGEKNSILMNLALEKYLQLLINKNIDTLILGCTHYGIIKNKIQKQVGNNVKIISEGQVVAKKLKDTAGAVIEEFEKNFETLLEEPEKGRSRQIAIPAD